MKVTFSMVIYFLLHCATFKHVTLESSHLNIRNEDDLDKSALYNGGKVEVESLSQSCNLMMFNLERNPDVIFDENFDDGFKGWKNPSNVIIVKENPMERNHTRVKRQRIPQRKTSASSESEG